MYCMKGDGLYDIDLRRRKELVKLRRFSTFEMSYRTTETAPRS
jgi:hypothetical protein